MCIWTQRLCKPNTPKEHFTSLLFLSLFLIWLLTARVWECVDGEPLHTRLTAGVFEHHPQSTIFRFDVSLCMYACVFFKGWLNDIPVFLVATVPIYGDYMCVKHTFISFVSYQFDACAMRGIVNRVVCFLSVAAAASTANLSVICANTQQPNRMNGIAVLSK